MSMFKSVAGRKIAFTPKQFPIRLSKRVGLRHMQSVGGITFIRTLGPSTVTSATGIAYPSQKRCFYANGRFWVFWVDIGGVYYSTSKDGIIWEETKVVGFIYSDASIYFDGTYLHIAGYNFGNIYYRRGIPLADGNINWIADWQFAVSAGILAHVSVDAERYVWIGYRSLYAPYYPLVTKSGNNDGTWGTTPNGFPYQLSTISSTNWAVQVIPLTSNKMLVIYAFTSPIRIRAWDGSSWKTEVVGVNAARYGWNVGAAAEGDDVHIVFLKVFEAEPWWAKDLIYTKYSYTENTLEEEIVLVEGVYQPSTLSIDEKNNLYVFWPNYPESNSLYYLKGKYGAWKTPVQLLKDEPIYVPSGSDYGPISFCRQYDNYIGLVYEATGYGIRFFALKL